MNCGHDSVCRTRPIETDDKYCVPERYQNMINDFRLARQMDHKEGLISREDLPKQHTAIIEVAYQEFNHGEMIGATDLEVTDEELRCVRLLKKAGSGVISATEYFFPLKDYNRTWRCWFNSPTGMMRQEEKWDVCDDAG